jgi:hypothetical protein
MIMDIFESKLTIKEKNQAHKEVESLWLQETT